MSDQASEEKIDEIFSAVSDQDVRVGFKLTRETYESLKALNDSNFWKEYRKILLNAKNEFFHATLRFDEPHKIMKNIGMVAGINFAINQLPILVAEYNRVVQREIKRAEGK